MKPLPSTFPLAGAALAGCLAISGTAALTQAADAPEAPSSSLPGGLITEPVEPGVLRVLRDGAGHELTFDPTDQRTPPFDGIAAAPDGRVFVMSHADDKPRSAGGQYVADLWEVGGQDAAEVSIPSSLLDVAVGPDGTVWAAGEGRYLARFDGDGWEVLRHASSYAELLALAIGGDGTVWGAWRGIVSGPEEPGVVARYDGTEWVDVIGDEWARHGGRTLPFKMAATSDGSVWAGVGPGSTLARYADGAWELAWPLGDEVDHAVHALAVAPDGDLWALLETFSPSAKHLARFDGEAWSTFSEADGVPQKVSPWLQGDWYGDRGRYMEVDAEGRVWLIGSGGGVVAWDGDKATQYLEGRRIADLAITPDGAVWAVGVERDGSATSLYVILPETAATTG